MAELLKHAGAMKKVQEEVRNVAGNKSRVDMEDINRMEYLKCYDIPSDTTISINSWAIHRDPEWWEKPEEFIRERFENNSIDFQGQDFHYIPFGFGRRACPGMLFGAASVEYVLANLLCWFDWKLPRGEIAEDLDMTELYGLTITRKKPLYVLPTPHPSY
ncbi:hypothetical protein GQ457_14G024280 [Hibiscus cannabinus]